MTSTSRISDFPAGDQEAGGEVVVAQVVDGRRRTRTYDIGTAAGKNAGTTTGDVPVLGSGGALPTAQGGTGLAAAVPGPNKVFGTNAQGHPAIRDLPGGTPSLLDGAVTTPKLAEAAVTGPKLGVEAVAADNLKADAVTAEKLATGAVGPDALAAEAVETAKLAPQAVTAGKLGQGAVNNAALGSKAVRLANLDYSGTPTDGQVLAVVNSGGSLVLAWVNKGDLALADGAVTTPKLAAGAVKTEKIGAGAVGTAALADGACTLVKLDLANTGEAGQVLTKNADGQLEFRNLQEADEVADGSITASKLAANSVTLAKIAGETITNAAISPTAAIDLAKLSILGTPVTGYTIQSTGGNSFAWRPSAGLGSLVDGSLGERLIATQAISTNKLRDGAVTDIKVAADADIAVTKLDIGGTQASGKFLSATSTTEASWVDRPETEPVDGSVTTAKLASGAVTGSKLSNNAVSGNILAEGGVAGSKLADLAVGTAKLASGAVTGSKLAANSVGFGNLIIAGSVGDEQVLTFDVSGGVTTLKATDKSATGVADGSITTSKLADDAVTEAKIAASSITPSMLKTG